MKKVEVYKKRRVCRKRDLKHKDRKTELLKRNEKNIERGE